MGAIWIKKIFRLATLQEVISLHILHFDKQAYDIYCLSNRLSSEGLQLLVPNRLITHVRREVAIANPDRAAEGLSNVPDYRGSLTRRHPSQCMMGRHLIANWLPSLKMRTLFGRWRRYIRYAVDKIKSPRGINLNRAEIRFLKGTYCPDVMLV